MTGRKLPRSGLLRPGLPGLLRSGLLGGLLAALALWFGAGAAGAGAVPSTGAPRVVMILVDNHLSETSALANEHEAVLNYATALPAYVRTGVIVFSDHWQFVLRPTTNRQQLLEVMAQVRPEGAVSTGIYGALNLAAAQMTRLHAGTGSRFVVFSDAEALARPLPPAPVPADVVLWHIDADDNLPLLRNYAAANGGKAVHPPDASALAQVFPAVAPGTAGSPGANQHTPPPSAAPAGRTAGASTPWLLVAGLVALFLALFLVAFVVIRLTASRVAGRDLAGQLEHYGPRRRVPVSDDEHGRLARSALDLVSRAMTTTTSQQRLSQRLDLAAIARKPAEWVLLGICASAVVAAVVSLATQYVFIGILGGALIGWLTMRLTVSIRIARRRAAFSDQLADLLQLIAGSLQSGFSLPQALDSVVREDTQPAAGEFARALAEARIGGDIADGLDAVANRMDSEDLRWTVMAIRIQRGVGGNLGEVLHTIAGTIRERAYLRRQVRALSAEGRLSAYVLVALPVLVGGWLFITSSRYMRPLYTTPVGLVMLLGSVTLVVVGAMWMRVLVKVEV